MVQFPPFTVSEVTPRVVRSLFAGMWRPSRRPPRRTMAGMGVMAQMFCDAGDSGTQFTSAPPPHPGLDGGFCSIRRVLSACRRRVAPLMVQFPPFGGDVTGRHVAQGSSCSATPPACWRRGHASGQRGAHAHAVGPTFVLVRALGVVLRAIRLGEFSMVCVSVAISAIGLRGGARCWGNCMRHSWIARRVGVVRCRSWRCW